MGGLHQEIVMGSGMYTYTQILVFGFWNIHNELEQGAYLVAMCDFQDFGLT